MTKKQKKTKKLKKMDKLFETKIPKKLKLFLKEKGIGINMEYEGLQA